MPLSVTTVYSGPFTPNGVTTIFPFDFKALDPAEVAVTDSRGDPISGLDYAVEIAAEGGNVVFGDAPEVADLASFFIASLPTFEQDVEFTPVGIFNPRTLQTPFDRTAVRDAWLRDRVDRAISFPMGEAAPVLPVAEDRAGKFLAFDAGGGITAASGLGADAGLREDLAGAGAALVGLPDGTVADAIKYVTPQMKGGTGTVAIQAAIDSNTAELQFPPASYTHGDLSFDNQYQRVLGWGSVLTRSGSGVTTTLGARGVQCFAARFSGAGASGENITVTKPDVALLFCDSRDTTGTPLLAENDASNLLVLGGVYSVTDPGGTLWDIELRDAVGEIDLYARIIGISTNQGSGNEGGILAAGPGTVGIGFCQFGKLRMEDGSGGMFVGNRVNGDTAILSPASQFSCGSFAGDVTFGDGSGPNIGQICFGPSNAVQSGQTLTVGSEVIESTFHLGHIEAGGSTVVVNNYNNNIWHDSRAYTPTVAAEGGGFVMGASTIEGWHSHDGRKAELFIRFTAGAGFNFGTGPIYFTTPVDNGYAVPAPMNCKHGAIGSVYMLDDGTTHKIGVARMSTTDSAKRGRIYIFSEGSNAPVSATVPFTWAAGDRIELSIRFEWDSE